MAWKLIDLTGTKNGSNTSFVIPFAYLANTLTIIHNNDHVKLRSVDFGNAGAKSFTASVASGGAGGSIEGA